MRVPFWPTQTDFQDALQNPAQCFADRDLQHAAPADLTPFGLPAPITGQFANVYRLRLPEAGGYRAVRLFIHAAPDRPLRYDAIQQHLSSLKPIPSWLTAMEYQPQGIFLRGTEYPMVKMEWIAGKPLNSFVDAHLYESERLRTLAAKFRTLIQDLRDSRIAHGDLQHGNLLVEEAAEGKEGDTLRLVDYDGLWVPALSGREGVETGHPSFQHPQRTSHNFGPFLDRFAALVIYTALRVVIEIPQVWYQLDNGDNLLFQRDDFADPSRSRAFILLKDALKRASPEARHAVETLQTALAGSLSAVPDLPR